MPVEDLDVHAGRSADRQTHGGGSGQRIAAVISQARVAEHGRTGDVDGGVAGRIIAAVTIGGGDDSGDSEAVFGAEPSRSQHRDGEVLVQDRLFAR